MVHQSPLVWHILTSIRRRILNFTAREYYEFVTLNGIFISKKNKMAIWFLHVYKKKYHLRCAARLSPRPITLPNLCQLHPRILWQFADDTNAVYADKNLKSLESTVNQELCKLFDWLTANKLTLNIKKTNFVIFRPAQRKLTYHPEITIFDNDQNKNVALECKESVRHLGIIIDNNLSWKHHIDHVAIKMSRTVELICKLRHFLQRHTLLTIYRSLVAPYSTYGLMAWGKHINRTLKSFSSFKSEL